MAIRWVKAGMSTRGSVEAKIEIPNPVEPAYPFKLRLVIFNLQSDDPREKQPEDGKRWRAHASMNGELFRLYAATRDDAKKRVEEGLRKIFGDLMSAVSAVEPRSP
jgi:hypothetical protein